MSVEFQQLLPMSCRQYRMHHMSPRIPFAIMLVSLCSPALAAAQTPPAPAPAQTPAPPPAQTPASPPAPAPPPAPLTIKIGDADFKLGGFLDAASVIRSTNLGSGLPTTYGTIPFENTPQGNLHEVRLSSQSSRASGWMAASPSSQSNAHRVRPSIGAHASTTSDGSP